MAQLISLSITSRSVWLSWLRAISAKIRSSRRGRGEDDLDRGLLATVAVRVDGDPRDRAATYGVTRELRL